MTIFEIIKKSGRFEYLMKMLFDLALTQNPDIPVYMYEDTDGKCKYRLKMDDLRKSIKFWLICGEMKVEEIADLEDEAASSLTPLMNWARGKIEMLSHNYANAVSHRDTPSESDMEDIRVLNILESSIDYILCPWSPDPYDKEPMEFDIPKGWAIQE